MLLVVKYESSVKIAEPTAIRHVFQGGCLARNTQTMREAEEKPLWGRMHESGYFFYCPRCALSFPHPPHIESFYQIGYGLCWYCMVWTPITGRDRRGIVRVNRKGELYTHYYAEEDRRKALEHERLVRRLCGMDKPKGKD